MLYASDESGSFQVYVRAYPDTGGKWQISNAGGTYPEWSSDGRAIFFRTPDNQIMTANYTAKGDGFTAEKPRLFAEQRLAEVGPALNWDLHPDGKRIVGVLPAEASGGPGNDGAHVTILLNFFDELRRKVPVGK